MPDLPLLLEAENNNMVYLFTENESTTIPSITGGFWFQ
jgi:hypothetical protein